MITPHHAQAVVLDTGVYASSNVHTLDLGSREINELCLKSVNRVVLSERHLSAPEKITLSKKSFNAVAGVFPSTFSRNHNHCMEIAIDANNPIKIESVADLVGPWVKDEKNRNPELSIADEAHTIRFKSTHNNDNSGWES